MALTHEEKELQQAAELAVAPLFALDCAIPRHTLPEDELSSDLAYQIIHDELMLDGNVRLNVATFVTTWMEPGRTPDGRVPRQEHDRQGRVPADGGD
jgi:glutamate decarboxylase